MTDTDRWHDPLEDVSSRRRVTGVEAEVVGVLGWAGHTLPWVRLSDADWHKVDALVARIEHADAIPAPRAGDGAAVRGGAR